jgi:WD40 repeat protein
MAVVYLWDLETCVVVSAAPTLIPRSPLLAMCDGHTDSIYSLALSHEGTLVVSSGVEKSIRGWDARTGKRAFKLRGHQDSMSLRGGSVSASNLTMIRRRCQVSPAQSRRLAGTCSLSGSRR